MMNLTFKRKINNFFYYFNELLICKTVITGSVTANKIRLDGFRLKLLAANIDAK